MTELEQRLINDLSRLAEQYEREQKQLAEQVETLAEQVERLQEDMKQFAQQYATLQKDQYQRLPMQLSKFEKDVQLFVAQVKKEREQRDRLESRIEELGGLSGRVESLTKAFNEVRENLNVLLR